MTTSRLRTVAALVLALALAGCMATQPDLPALGEEAGFLHGLWHGFISPIAFLIGIFTDARIYAYPNTGLFYDFGFMLGIGGFSGGVFAGSKQGSS